MGTTQGRLLFYIKEVLGMNVTEFEQSIHAGHAVVHKYLKKEGDCLPSDDLWKKIITKYPKIDRVFILTGIDLKSTSSDNSGDNEPLRQRVLQLEKKLSEQNEELLKAKDESIAALKKLSGLL